MGNIFPARFVFMCESTFEEAARMKKLTALLCLVLALVSLSALAADAETDTTLWPACGPAEGLQKQMTL